MKKKHKLLHFVLIVAIFISSLLPFNAYAANSSVTHGCISMYNGSEWQFSPDVEFPYTYTADFISSDLSQIDIDFLTPIDIKEGDSVTIKMSATGIGRYADFNSAGMVLLAYPSGQFDSFEYDANNGYYYFYYTALNDIEKGSYSWISLADPVYNSSFNTSAKAAFRVNSITITTESQSSSFFQKVGNWFSNLFQWLKDIRDNAVNGFSNIGTWFTNLGNNIKNWFSNLSDNISSFFSNLISNIKTQFTNITNNLKEWFSNVGQWFSDIGDRISGFFSNLWNNIELKVEAMHDWWNSLFTPEDGWSDSYKLKWDNWMASHFGFIYQSVNMIDDIIENISNSFDDDYSGDLIIEVPQLKLPSSFVPGRVSGVLLSKSTYNLSDLTGSNVINTVLSITDVVISALFYFSLLMYGKKTFEIILAEREL